MFLKTNGIPLWEMHGTSQSLRGGAQGEQCTHQKKGCLQSVGEGTASAAFLGRKHISNCIRCEGSDLTTILPMRQKEQAGSCHF